MSGFELTDEQKDILQADAHDLVSKIQGMAGAAKTHQLVLLAKNRIESGLFGSKVGMYVAFNAQAVEDAKKRFPPGMLILTNHSLALRESGGYGLWKAKLEKRLFPEQIIEIVNLKGMPRSIAMSVAMSIRDTIEKFCNSGNPKLDEDSVVMASSLSRRKDLEPKVLELSRFLFGKMYNPADPCPTTHSVYLKRWELSGARIPKAVGWILFDEAQDANGVQISAMLKQTVPVTWVGDQHQEIYRFRGAVNALTTIDGKSRYLTQSFRYGPVVAMIANAVLNCKSEEKRPEKEIRGFESAGTVIGRVDKSRQYIFLARTRSECFREVAASRESISVIGGVKELVKVLDAAYGLYAGDRAKARLSPEISRFPSWNDLQEFAEAFQDKELLSIKSLVEEYGGRLPQILEDVVRRATRIETARIIVGTFHSTKGLEFDQVKIGDATMVHPGSDKWDEMSEEEKIDEINLIYVAVTRVKRVLELSPGVVEFMKRSNGSPDVFRPEVEAFIKKFEDGGFFGGVVPPKAPEAVRRDTTMELARFGKWSEHQDGILRSYLGSGSVSGERLQDLCKKVNREACYVSLRLLFLGGKTGADPEVKALVGQIVEQKGNGKTVLSQIDDALQAA